MAIVDIDTLNNSYRELEHTFCQYMAQSCRVQLSLCQLRNLKLSNLYLKKHKKNIMTVKEFHKKASELSQKAIVLMALGQDEEANFTYKEAFEYEKKAALVLLDKIDKEPSRSILFRSAAALALKAGLFRDSEQMAACGLAGNPPDNVLDELKDLSNLE